MPPLFVGLISGTSVDSIDAVLVELEGDSQCVTRACHQHSVPEDLRLSLLDTFARDSLQFTLDLDVQLGHLFADAVEELLAKAGTSPSEVRAIGSHGQTVSHQPHRTHPHTLQIGDPNVIAERTGITTVADFRRRDMAAGGQGAPLAPAFHAALFSERGKARVVVNIGGIANLSLLPTDAEQVFGFDTGPGNALLDAWTYKNLGTRFDTDASWTASGTIVEDLLQRLLDDEYFKLSPPKSTGKERFNLDWIERILASYGHRVDAQHIQRTLAELTIVTITDAIGIHAPDCDEVLVCGGGVHNPVLLSGLKAKLTRARIQTTADHGVDPDYVEACAFAWLAKQTLDHVPVNLTAVTGAKRPVVLGGVYSSS